MQHLRQTLILQIRHQLNETWPLRIETLTNFLNELQDQILKKNTQSSPRPRKRSVPNNNDFLSDIPDKSSNNLLYIPIIIRDGQSRIKNECFQLLQECDRVRVLVNLQFPKISSNEISSLEDVLSELSQAQSTCTIIRASISKYARTRAKVIGKGGGEERWVAVQEIDEEAIFLIFHYSTQLRNIYVVLYTLVQRYRSLLCL
ncbi:hypothetical protein PNEG_02296 [Pneumocystis murina B123]|uniref:Proteasome activator PA28 C-terminal domain-containing protein n=1 Tax=Pneumocystis murina (strain B123) TaxID=1069680 RepID=M7NQ05_PNEMU|nr:hypothetical protein PNEG_02296 [Pneumocystis murina B123]EMR09342.1 hypothetical protein PNEG_02296 [Pneumocystis murina B123]